MEQLNCFICETFIFGGLNELQKHFINDHNISVTNTIPVTGFICAQNGCEQNFVYFYNLRRHIQKYHLAIPDLPPIPINIANNDPHQNEDDNMCGMGDMGDDVQMQEHRDVGVENVEETDDDVLLDLRSFVIKMTARFHSYPSVTGTLLTNIFEEIEKLLLYYNNFVKGKIFEKLKIGEIIDDVLLQDINQITELDNPFDGLKTYKQQVQSVIDNYGYIEPTEIVLGYRMDTVLDKKTCTYVPKRVIESFQYVPIIDVLKLVLSSKEVRKAIAEEKDSSDGILSSFRDGERFKNHPFFQQHKNAIRFKVYNDELEIVNPLGSKTGVHKLDVFYYQITNLPAHMNSELNRAYTSFYFALTQMLENMVFQKFFILLYKTY